jgi:hypothetical protein
MAGCSDFRDEIVVTLQRQERQEARGEEWP